jgi:hypothetical protein
MKRIHRASSALRIALFLALGLATFPLAGQTVLLMAAERTSAGPIGQPLAIREGIADALFGAGLIVVEVPVGYERPADLAAFARNAGADFVLDVSALYVETSAGGNRVTVVTTTSVLLLDAIKGTTVLKTTDEATNKGREALVDRAALGKEIGGRIVDAVEKAIAG